MRSLSTKMLAVAVIALLVSPAFAQRQGGGGRQGGGRGGFGGFGRGPQAGSMLLLNRGVQDELKLTDEQKAELKKVQDEQREAFQKLRDAGGDRAKAQEIMQKAREDMTKAADKVKANLKPEQAKRFKQIQIQVGGLTALNLPEVQKDLNLTDKQKSEIKSIQEDAQKDARELFQGAGRGGNRGQFQELMQKVQKLNEEAMDKALGVLTTEQKQTLKELQGPKFDFKPDQFGGGRQGGRRGGRQGGGQPPQ